MTVRRRTRSAPLAVKAAELALAAPQVVAHRLWRMALSGPEPSARDRAEFHMMGAEKAAAFAESWQAMWWQAWRVQQDIALSLWRVWLPWLPGARVLSARDMKRAANRVLGAGLAPVHRRAVANAKRLGNEAAARF